MVTVLIALLILAFPPVLHSSSFAALQDAGKDPVQAKADSDAFFSGSVLDLTDERVTVSRTILGKAPEKRTFLITGSTKVEGKMKQKSRVTVRYAASDDGDVALSILVREAADRPDKKK